MGVPLGNPLIGVFYEHGVKKGDFVATAGDASELATIPCGRLHVRLFFIDRAATDVLLSFKGSEDPSQRYAALNAVTDHQTQFAYQAARPSIGGDEPLKPKTLLVEWEYANRAETQVSRTLSCKWTELGFIDPQPAPFELSLARSNAAFVQIIQPERSSVCVRLPRSPSDSGGDLRINIFPPPLDDEVDESRPFWTAAATSLTWCDYYHLFLASGATQAARILGQRILRRVISSTERSEPAEVDDILTSGHYAARYHVESDQLQRVLALLRRCGDEETDGGILTWLLDFDCGHTERAKLARGLRRDLMAFDQSPPIYSETVRLLADRLRYARRVFTEEGYWTDADDNLINRFQQYSEAMYWDTPYTTYRALNPLEPRRQAVFASISEAKESFENFAGHAKPTEELQDERSIFAHQEPQTNPKVRGGNGAVLWRDLEDAIRDNLVPVALVGTGLAWLMLSGSRFRSRVDYYENDDLLDEYAEGGQASTAGLSEAAGQTTQEWGESARSTAGQWAERARASERGARRRAREFGAEARHGFSETGEHLREGRRGARSRTSYYGRRVRRSFLDVLSEHPLVLGAIGLAVGAALGAVLPATEKEDEWMGDMRDRLKDRAKEAGREQIDKARAAASAAYEAARDEADRQGLTPEGGGRAAAASVQHKAEKVAEAATDAARSAAERQELGEARANTARSG